LVEVILVRLGRGVTCDNAEDADSYQGKDGSEGFHGGFSSSTVILADEHPAALVRSGTVLKQVGVRMVETDREQTREESSDRGGDSLIRSEHLAREDRLRGQ
jgi:hypothetical protein